MMRPSGDTGPSIPGSDGQLRAEVAHVRYRAPDGDFAVLSVLTEDGEEAVVVGALAHLHTGEEAVFSGAWRAHERHGRQFVAVGVQVGEPSSDAALVGLLSTVKHLGTAGAAWLVARHGSEVLEVVDADPGARLLEVPGIGRAKLPAVTASWQEARAARAVRLFLDAHGVPAAVTGRVVRALGPAAVELLTEDPYRLAELDGIGFATADALAQALGLAPDAPARLRAGALHALREAERDGHCLLPRAELCGRAARLLGGAQVDDAIDELAVAGTVTLDDAARVAEASMTRCEARLGAHVRELLGSTGVLGRAPARPAERAGGISPTPAQWSAVERVFAGRLSILTGGPGTGKTSALATLVDVLAARKLKAQLCAPTGKAARRMAEATGAEASTIHRLLGWLPGEGFARGPDDPIDDADVLIVDEASMLGVRLAEALLGAVGPRTHVVLVGDPDQLAPIGPGRVLDDLLASERVPATRLTEVFRQAARSHIVRTAHEINHGELTLTAPDDPEAVRDLFVVRRDDPRATFAEIVSLAAERVPAHLGVAAGRDVQVLAPMRRGAVGIDALNAALRERLNPDGERVAGTPFRAGDRVIQTQNDYEHLVMNGETATILSVGDERVVVRADDTRVLSMPADALDTWRLAYAISVHKAQGSQFDAVVVVLSREHTRMWDRALLYTALTRASRLAVLVGDMALARTAVGRVDSGRRHTRLRELV